jgi:hypothetical protein
MLRHDVMDAPSFLKLSARAIKLLVNIARQYNGNNNGDLCVTAKVMKPRGWRSNDQLRKALEELEHFGFVVKSRQGGRHKCSLYALTFFPIDHCGGKHDLIASQTPLNHWKVDKPIYRPKLKSVHRRADYIEPPCGLQSSPSVVQLNRRADHSGAKK